jgi:hypothetical protein
MSSFPKTPACGKNLYDTRSSWVERLDTRARPVLGRGGTQAGQIGGKILPAHVYRNEEEG